VEILVQKANGFTYYTLEMLVEISFALLLYHPGGCLGCPENWTSSTLICLFGPQFFSQNRMTLKKPTKIIKIQQKVTVF
jgi:hypothetical protein